METMRTYKISDGGELIIYNNPMLSEPMVHINRERFNSHKHKVTCQKNRIKRKKENYFFM